MSEGLGEKVLKFLSWLPRLCSRWKRAKRQAGPGSTGDEGSD